MITHPYTKSDSGLANVYQQKRPLITFTVRPAHIVSSYIFDMPKPLTGHFKIPFDHHSALNRHWYLSLHLTF